MSGARFRTIPVRIVLFCLPLVVGGWFPVMSRAGAGSPAAKPAAPTKEDKPYAVTYDVADLLAKEPPVNLKGSRVTAEPIDALGEMIVTTMNPTSWAPLGPNTMQEVNGHLLEIRTTAARHAEIVDLLGALRRLADISVVVKGELYEVDRAFVEHATGTEPLRTPTQPGKDVVLPVGEELLRKFHKQATLLKSNKVTIDSGQEASVLSWHTLVTYAEVGGSDAKKKRLETYKTVFPGTGLRAAVIVSADRRRVRLKIVQNCTELIQLDSDSMILPLGEEPAEVQRPRLLESSTALTMQVDDGQCLLFPVQYRPPSTKNDRVLVMLVQPVIWIEEEQKALKQSGKGG